MRLRHQLEAARDNRVGVALPRWKAPVGAVLTLILAMGLVGPNQAAGQALDPRVAVIPEADSLFERAVRAFDEGRYVDAAGQFSRVSSLFNLHRYTTAAALMEARALYRVGQFSRAQGAFSDFVRRFPSSSYVSEAERGLRLASQAERATTAQPMTLGIVLSLADDEASATQAMFNGIRLAVDAHNLRQEVRPVRMVYRDIDAIGARGAVESAVAAGAQVVVGALFSDQAVEAAAAAERAGVVFVSPLATDPRVSEGRTFSFQANPSIPARGRLMARFAINGLRLRNLAVIAESDDMGISEQMGNAFAEQARAMGAQVALVKVFPTSSGWFRIGAELSADTLRGVEGLYAPLAGDRADRLAGAFLAGLDEILGTGIPGQTSDLRVLGNAEWHDLPLRIAASRYTVTYSNDYHFEAESTRGIAFTRRYETLTGTAPNRLSVVGYDLATFLLQTVDTVDPEAARRAIAMAAPFQGLGVRIHFDGRQVNQTMYYHRYRDGALRLMR